MHIHRVENEHGHLEDVIPFCCDNCQRAYCEEHPDIGPYGGWDGCHEGGDSPEWCANCGVWCGGEAQCEHQLHNVVVNRFLSENGEKCNCGHWVQLPAGRLA